MFKLVRPCATCPFKKKNGPLFRLKRARLNKIFRASAFQCHSTLDEKFEDADPRRRGDKPQQCAGLMSILSRAGQPNQIMQVGQRFGAFDPSKLDHSEVYKTMSTAIAAHNYRWRGE